MMVLFNSKVSSKLTDQKIKWKDKIIREEVKEY